MPELPELETMRAFLAPRIVDIPILSAQVRRPIVVRNLLGGNLADRLVGHFFTGVGRRGKFLLLSVEDGTYLAINPMLVGRLRHGPPLNPPRKRDALLIGLADGSELSYNDTRDMGKIYLTDDLERVPTWAGMGPEATDPDLTEEAFFQRWQTRRGEVKETLVSQTFVAGIGNAYADEICWAARIYPFRRTVDLDRDEIVYLYAAMRDTLCKAIETLAARGDPSPGDKGRDFLSIHGRPGQPCPRCGSTISRVTRQQQPTDFCRTCQPGLLTARRPRSSP